MKESRLVLDRHSPGITCTIGDLTIDGRHLCNTLEPLKPIPAGTYRLEVCWSPRFRRDLPLIIGVPGHDGIRIHAGNTHEDTRLCVLVGSWVGGEFLKNSRPSLEALMDMLTISSISKLSTSIEINDSPKEST